MENEPLSPGVTAKPPAGIRLSMGALGSRRGAIAFVTAVLLAALLGFLYVKTQGVDIKRQNEALSYFRELKETDARWDVEVFRSRAELALPPSPAIDHGAGLARIQQELTAAAHDLGSPVLARGLPDLFKAFAEKAALMAKFRKANTEAKQALQRVSGADSEIAALVRGAWQDFPQRERLVAVENVFAQLQVSAQKYYFVPTEAQRKDLETIGADLLDSKAPLPPALRDGLSRLATHVKQLLDAKLVEQQLFTRVSFLTAGPRIDSLTNAFNHELEQKLVERERYRVYLFTYSGALLILIGLLATRLFASYRLLAAANLALKAANEGLEQRVAERTQELSGALNRLKESEAQLIQTEKMSSLGQMVAGVAHEINTPLAYIKNSLGSVKGRLPDLVQLIAENETLLTMLQAGGADPHQLSRQFTLAKAQVRQFRENHALEELQSLVKDGLHGIEQISDIVANLRDFSRLDRSKVALFNLNDGLESTLLLAKHEIKPFTINRQFGDVPPITCSPSQINQVFLNLINNAAQAIETGAGTITLTTHREGPDHVAVEIEDSGKGIPPEVLSRIFDPFFTTKAVGKGTGLGLSIVYKIVKAHGGKITVDSKVGVGTKFTVVLPVTPPSQNEAAA